jgi:hypothetical protein
VRELETRQMLHIKILHGYRCSNSGFHHYHNMMQMAELHDKETANNDNFKHANHEKF